MTRNINDEDRAEVIKQLADSYAAMDLFGKTVVVHAISTHIGPGNAVRKTIFDALEEMNNAQLSVLYLDIEDNGDLVPALKN